MSIAPRIEEFQDGALCLSLTDGDTPDTLVFSEGYTRGDPLLQGQREMLEELMVAWNIYAMLKPIILMREKDRGEVTE